MSATVEIDIVDGSSLEEDENGNLKKVRIAKVYGLTGTRSAREYDALNLAGVPQRGDYHPDISSIYVLTRLARAESADLVEVTCTYGTPNGNGNQQLNDPPRIEVRSSFQQDTTTKDKDGNLITCSYTPGNNSDFPAVIEHTLEVSYPKPMFSLVFTRLESERPDAIARAYSGKVNSGAFYGCAARTMLMKIDGVSNDGGNTYSVTYELQYNSDGWDKTYSVEDSATGRIPGDVSIGNGQVKPQVIKEADFSALGL